MNIQDDMGSPDTNAQIWGGEQSGRKITRRRVIAGGALVGSAALALGLYFGLAGSESSRSQNIISGQATDPNAEGCFIDTRDRVMESQYNSDAMTPEVSHGATRMTVPKIVETVALPVVQQQQQASA